MSSVLLAEKLKIVIKEDLGVDITLEEALQILADLVGYFDLLAKIHHKSVAETAKDQKNEQRQT
jgi:hypothetical protein